jgi:hypothetical protein
MPYIRQLLNMTATWSADISSNSRQGSERQTEEEDESNHNRAPNRPTQKQGISEPSLGWGASAEDWTTPVADWSVPPPVPDWSVPAPVDDWSVPASVDNWSTPASVDDWSAPASVDNRSNATPAKHQGCELDHPVSIQPYSNCNVAPNFDAGQGRGRGRDRGRSRGSSGQRSQGHEVRPHGKQGSRSGSNLRRSVVSGEEMAVDTVPAMDDWSGKYVEFQAELFLTCRLVPAGETPNSNTVPDVEDGSLHGSKELGTGDGSSHTSKAPSPVPPVETIPIPDIFDWSTEPVPDWGSTSLFVMHGVHFLLLIR